MCVTDTRQRQRDREGEKRNRQTKNECSGMELEGLDTDLSRMYVVSRKWQAR